MALCSPGALSVLDVCDKFCRASYMLPSSPWDSVFAEQRAFAGWLSVDVSCMAMGRFRHVQ